MVVEIAGHNGQSIEMIEPEAGMYLEDFAASLAQQLVGLAVG